MYKIILNTKFITLNEYINAERSNKFAAAKIKETQTNNVYYLAKQQNFNLPKNTKFDVIFNWYVPNNKRDNDNIAFAKKFILDGLVLAKILQNDGTKYIGNFQDNFILDKTRNYISCIVIFRGDNKDNLLNNKRELLIGYSKFVLRENFKAFEKFEIERIDKYLANLKH